MFLSFIPAWFACCLLYGASPKQKILNKPLPFQKSWLTALLLIGLVVAILLFALPIVSALIMSLSLICCFLPLVTLISAYKRQYLYLSTAIICLIALSSPVFNWLNFNFGGNV